MKKLFLILLAITLITPVYADKLLKNGFLNKKMNYAKEQNINAKRRGGYVYCWN